MDNIKVGYKISVKRKEKGITQEELANYLGVSKPAVSKWESGQSYPDILLLPLIASYFNISVDELIGYEPQMTKEDIRKLYHRLSNDFAVKPFLQVYEECMEYSKKYYSCWNLQVQIGLLLINHASAAKDAEKMNEVIKKAMELFDRTAKSSEDVNLAKQAIQMKAYCYLCLQEPIEAIDLLDNLKDNFMPTETLLIKAYQMKGDKQKAVQYLQGFTYINLINVINSSSDYFAIYSDQPERMQFYYDKFTSLIKIFDIPKLQPSILISFYLTAAQVFTIQGNKDKAIDALGEYIHVSKEAVKCGFALDKNEFFDQLEQYFNEMEIDTQAPRSSALIRNDINSLILQNPAFASLETEERFQKMKSRIEKEQI